MCDSILIIYFRSISFEICPVLIPSLCKLVFLQKRIDYAQWIAESYYKRSGSCWYDNNRPAFPEFRPQCESISHFPLNQLTNSPQIPPREELQNYRRRPGVVRCQRSLGHPRRQRCWRQTAQSRLAVDDNGRSSKCHNATWSLSSWGICGFENREIPLLQNDIPR